MSYNSCRINQAHKSVLKYTPKNKHILTKAHISLLKNQINTIVYLTLNEDEGFWFYIKECNDKQLRGFAKKNDRWVFRTIDLDSINTFC